MQEASPKKILLVNDNSRVLKLLELRLSQQGYQVFTAERGKDAIVSAIIVRPDLVVSELQLPDLKGIEFKRILGSIPAVAEVPIVFLSFEKDLPLDLQTEPGAPVDHLQKPYAFEALLSKVESNLRRAAVRQSALSPAQHRGGVLQEMTLTDILQVLAMNRRSCTITLRQNDKTGKIYFRSGRIVDVKAPGLRAEGAFYDLLTWSGADYTIGDEPENSAEETVTLDTRSLIAEGLRRLTLLEESSKKTAGHLDIDKDLGPACHLADREQAPVSADIELEEVEPFVLQEEPPVQEDLEKKRVVEIERPTARTSSSRNGREELGQDMIPQASQGPAQDDELTFLKNLVARGLLKEKRE